MDIEDIFDRGRRRGDHGRGGYDDGYRHNDNHEYSRGGHHEDELPDFSQLAKRILPYKKFLLPAGIVLLVVLATGVVFFLPLLGKTASYVNQNGIKSVVERLWLGTGNKPLTASGKD